MNNTRLKSDYSRKELLSGPEKPILKELASHNLTQWIMNVLHCFLGLVFDSGGEIPISTLKSKLRLLFVSTTFNVVVDDAKIDEVIQYAIKKNLVTQNPDKTSVAITKRGERIAQNSYFLILHHNYWSSMFMKEKAVLTATAVILLILLRNPGHADRRFRWMPSTRSGPCRPPVPVAWRPFFRGHRNQWSPWSGFSGRHTPESLGVYLIE